MAMIHITCVRQEKGGKGEGKVVMAIEKVVSRV